MQLFNMEPNFNMLTPQGLKMRIEEEEKRFGIRRSLPIFQGQTHENLHLPCLFSFASKETVQEKQKGKPQGPA